MLASWIRIQGEKYRPKTAKKSFDSQNPKKEIIKISLPLNGS